VKQSSGQSTSQFLGEKELAPLDNACRQDPRKHRGAIRPKTDASNFDSRFCFMIVLTLARRAESILTILSCELGIRTERLY
jgi:hypothetical protein